MTTENGGPLSLGPIPIGRLKNSREIDKRSSLSLCLSVGGMSVTGELGLYFGLSGWVKRILSPAVQGGYFTSNTPHDV